MLKQRILRYLPRHRSQALVRRIDRMCMRFHEAFENLDYDFHANGEDTVLRKLAAHASPAVVFDVGANRGEWARMAEARLPEATIHAFEIVPDTFRQLSANCAGHDRIVPHLVGMSDSPGQVDVYYDRDGSSEIATCLGGVSEAIHGYQPASLRADVTSGDAFCEQNAIERIDFLKLDVEGFEPNVLRGFGAMLSAGRIGVIQFEYGYGNILSRFLLKDFYDLLEPHGMRIGKIFPETVEFRDYDLRAENFLGPNFIAVLASSTALIRALEA